MDRSDIADHVARRLADEAGHLKSMYQASEEKIGYFFIDDLLPEDVAKKIYACFPEEGSMRMKKSLREYKYVAAQMDNYNPILEEAIYAFQDPRVVSLVSGICGMDCLYPDELLYAGGISRMSNRNFLNPHIDNSHDNERNRWRVLNLLYYVTPHWSLKNGGHLEIWPDGVREEQVVIHSKFNRLAVMATHGSSWHSVSPVSCEDGARCCVSNYYFSDAPLRRDDAFHVTSFRGRPGQRLKDVLLQADMYSRMAVRKVFKKGVVENRHVYKKPEG